MGNKEKMGNFGFQKQGRVTQAFSVFVFYQDDRHPRVRDDAYSLVACYPFSLPSSSRRFSPVMG